MMTLRLLAKFVLPLVVLILLGLTVYPYLASDLLVYKAVTILRAPSDNMLQLNHAALKLKRAIRLRPGNWKARSFLSIVLVEQARQLRWQGRTEDAAALAKEALDYYPNQVVAYYELGSIYEALRNLVLAEEAYRNALLVSGRVEREMQSHSGRLFGSYDWQFPLVIPEPALCQQRLAAVLAKQGRRKEAREIWGQLLQSPVVSGRDRKRIHELMQQWNGKE